MTFEEIESDWRTAPEELKAEFKRLSEAWYSGWSSKGSDGFKQALWLAYNYGMSARPEVVATGWRPISDPPPDKEYVLIWYHDMGEWRVQLGRYLKGLDQWRPQGGNGDFRKDITHWMPMPPPPPQNSPSEKS